MTRSGQAKPRPPASLARSTCRVFVFAALSVQTEHGHRPRLGLAPVRRESSKIGLARQRNRLIVMPDESLAEHWRSQPQRVEERFWVGPRIHPVDRETKRGARRTLDRRWRRSLTHMNFLPGGHMGWVGEHDKLIRRYLAEHESEWRDLTGYRRLFARLRAERGAWKYAEQNLKWDRYDARHLY